MEVERHAGDGVVGEDEEGAGVAAGRIWVGGTGGEGEGGGEGGGGCVAGIERFFEGGEFADHGEDFGYVWRGGRGD